MQTPINTPRLVKTTLQKFKRKYVNKPFWTILFIFSRLISHQILLLAIIIILDCKKITIFFDTTRNFLRSSSAPQLTLYILHTDRQTDAQTFTSFKK